MIKTFLIIIICIIKSCSQNMIPTRENIHIENTLYRQFDKKIEGEIYSFIQFYDLGKWKYIPQSWCENMSKKDCPAELPFQLSMRAGWIYDYKGFNDNYLSFITKYPDIEYYFVMLKK